MHIQIKLCITGWSPLRPEIAPLVEIHRLEPRLRELVFQLLLPELLARSFQEN